jgi:hypothetical protein
MSQVAEKSVGTADTRIRHSDLYNASKMPVDQHQLKSDESRPKNYHAGYEIIIVTSHELKAVGRIQEKK